MTPLMHLLLLLLVALASLASAIGALSQVTAHVGASQRYSKTNHNGRPHSRRLDVIFGTDPNAENDEPESVPAGNPEKETGQPDAADNGVVTKPATNSPVTAPVKGSVADGTSFGNLPEVKKDKCPKRARNLSEASKSGKATEPASEVTKSGKATEPPKSEKSKKETDITVKGSGKSGKAKLDPKRANVSKKSSKACVDTVDTPRSAEMTLSMSYDYPSIAPTGSSAPTTSDPPSFSEAPSSCSKRYYSFVSFSVSGILFVVSSFL